MIPEIEKCRAWLPSIDWVLTDTRISSDTTQQRWVKGESLLIIKYHPGVEFWYWSSKTAKKNARYGKGITALGHCLEDCTPTILKIMTFEPAKQLPYDPEYPCGDWWASHGVTFVAGNMELLKLIPYIPCYRTDHLWQSYS